MTSDPEISQMIAAIAGERGGNDGLTI
jgi:hypothetical protein